jgi:hypothetical protein
LLGALAIAETAQPAAADRIADQGCQRARAIAFFGFSDPRDRRSYRRSFVCHRWDWRVDAQEP